MIQIHDPSFDLKDIQVYPRICPLMSVERFTLLLTIFIVRTEDTLGGKTNGYFGDFIFSLSYFAIIDWAAGQRSDIT